MLLCGLDSLEDYLQYFLIQLINYDTVIQRVHASTRKTCKSSGTTQYHQHRKNLNTNRNESLVVK